MHAARQAHIPRGTNLALSVLLAAANLLALFALPLWLPHQPWLALALLPLVLVTPIHWALIHEATHGLLYSGRRRNAALGRALSVLFGAPFAVLRFGHLLHHSLNGRVSERPDVYDPTQISRWHATLAFYPRLLGGLYLAEVAVILLVFLPRRWLAPLVRRAFYGGHPDAGGASERALALLTADQKLAEMRFDAACILLLFGFSALSYGHFWPLLALALLGRGLLVSLFDNAFHYGGPLGDSRHAFDTALPAPLSRLVLHGNLHGVHHRHPNVPWRHLPILAPADPGRDGPGYLACLLRQLRGPLPVTALERSGSVPVRGQPATRP